MQGGFILKFDIFNYEGKFARFMTRLMELVLLNCVFILTCLPIITIGASVTALYSISLKMVRKEESYVIRGYLKDFIRNFKQATIFWLIALLLYFLLYVIYTAAAVNGGTLLTVYTVITTAMAILYSIFFLFVFPLIATFKNTLKGTFINALSMIIAHFPMVLTAYLTIAVPFFVSFGVDTRIMQYALLFWILIGFSLLTLWSSVYINKIFSRYREEIS